MLSEASDGRKRKLKLFFEGSDDKKYKKELSSDAVEPLEGFFYCELRSTIVRVAWPSFVLLIIKGLLKAYHRDDLIAVLVNNQVHL